MRARDWINETDDEQVCNCFSIDKKTIVAVIKNGATTIQDIEKELGAGTGCGGCRIDILELLKLYGPNQ